VGPIEAVLDDGQIESAKKVKAQSDDTQCELIQLHNRIKVRKTDMLLLSAERAARRERRGSPKRVAVTLHERLYRPVGAV